MVTKKIAKKKVTEKKPSSKKVEKTVSFSKAKSMNIISVILGGFSIVAAFFFPYIVGFTGLLGVILAYVRKGDSFKKLNRWGFVLNVIAIFLAILVLTLSMIAFYMLLQQNGSLA